jgi:hypothetical protein
MVMPWLRPSSPLALAATLALAWGITGCSCSEEPGKASGGAGENAGGAPTGTGGDLIFGGTGNEPGTGGKDGGTSCDDKVCGAGQRCERTQGGAICVNNACADLDCSATEECAEAADGLGGFVCKSIACKTDVSCPPNRFCDGTKCVEDVCEAGTGECNGDKVVLCSSNGGELKERYTCQGNAYFTSECSDAAGAEVGCTCQDDWDCPANTVCDTGRCAGTGVAPTCTLPPVPFEDVKPGIEFQWGGVSTDAMDAVDGAGKPAPFPKFGQVVATPVVANLDDDNGDGLVNELDFPEIIFVAYESVADDANLDSDGVVRAVHGGGPNKGKDYFARCGSKLWREGMGSVPSCAAGDPDAVGSSAVAVADVTNDGLPEVIYAGEDKKLRVLASNGELLATSAAGTWTVRAVTLGVANLNNEGLPEIYVGANVFELGLDEQKKLVFTGAFTGDGPKGLHPGVNQGVVACVANLTGGEELELVAGSRAQRMPTRPVGVANQAACPVEDTSDYCEGKLVKVWDGDEANAETFITDGYCAIADVLGTNTGAAPGPANPLDGKPEVVLIADGNLIILSSSDGKLLRNVALGGGDRGGAPNIDDFDGDGFPEIATALSDFYRVYDLQAPTSACAAWDDALPKSGASVPAGNTARAPGGACTKNGDCAAGGVCRSGACVCLHNGWHRLTEDNSSRATSSSVFDFNGDGAAEVVYNDECYARVYDGKSGAILFAKESPSRTIVENPVVADVDNDGNAEIVTVMNTETFQCSENLKDRPNGIRVWGDPTDTWVSARRIWNQHDYYVTNITEGAGVLTNPPESWQTYAGRSYNTYRSQPRSAGVAPDLTVSSVGVSAQGSGCGTTAETVDIAFIIENQGDLRVGPGVVVAFEGVWDGSAVPLYADEERKTPLQVVIQNSLEPGASVLLSVPWTLAHSEAGVLPNEVRVTVDSESGERECNEENNVGKKVLDRTEALPDLRVDLGKPSGCPSPKLTGTLTNDGAVSVSKVLVRYYAGDPAQGGSVLAEQTIDGPISPGKSVDLSVTLTTFPGDRDILIYAVVDPLRAIAECNDANNRAAADDDLRCDGGIQ